MDKIIFWLTVFFVSCGLAYIVLDTLVPFFIAFIFAYSLQPLINNNSKRFGFSKGLVIFLVFVIFISLLLLIVILLSPIIYQQVSDFANKIPLYRSNFMGLVDSVTYKVNEFDPELASKVSSSGQDVVNSMFAIFTSFANHLWQYTVATINFFVIIALVPIILYYFLRDWDKMVQNIDSILPVKGKSRVRDFFVSVNKLLSAYIRGQLNICLILTCYYVTGISIVGLDLALLLGILSGFLIIIPFIGTVVSFILVIFSCYFTFGYGVELLYIISLFTAGHMIEGYILAPKIIGNKIGLHPLWIMFAVFAGANLFGILGILFAIPVAGIIKLLLSLMMDYYKGSKIYNS